jgi:hypothetical protein
VIERVEAGGVIGAIVWLATDKRIILRHESCVPSPSPGIERVRELEACGWRQYEIARMYDTDKSTVARRLTGRSQHRAKARL